MIEDKNVHYLDLEDKKIILIGTAHISHASVNLVRSVIEAEKPDAIAIELCEPRYQILQKDRSWQDMDLFKVIKENKTVVLIVNLLLASFQRKLAKQFDVKPGAEMRQAIDLSKEQGSQLVLIDRSVRTTLLRVINSMSFWAKIKFLGSGLGAFFSKEEISQDSIDKLTNGDELASMLESMNESSPSIKKSIIDERDLYMIEKIRQVSAKKIVAVVGAGHIPGMKANISTVVNLSELEKIPPKSIKMRMVKWLIPLIIIIIFSLGFYFGGSEKLIDLGKIWIINNAVFCALGALFTFAHPVTLLVAAIAAPITSLNPTIGAGMVCGLCEFFFRKPRVKEMESLLDDIETFSGWRRNSITRILLVIIATSIGSFIGTFMASYFLIQIF